MMNSPSVEKPSLLNDQRGAMMIMGIAMAMFLTGITWYMVGIGHMLVAHDHFQEAADSAAFTSATLHARGMNMMAALNLIMLALTGVYLILAILVAALLAATIATAASIIGIFGPAEALAAQTYELYQTWMSYWKFYKPAIKGINYVQTGAAVVFPWAGEAAAIDVGGRYGKATTDGAKPTSFAASASMIPGPNALKFAIKGPNAPAPASQTTSDAGSELSNPPAGGAGAQKPEPTGGPGATDVPEGGDDNACAGGGGKFTEKIALPVRAAPVGQLCTDLAAKILQFAMDRISDLTGVHIPDGGSKFGIPTDLDLGVDVRGFVRDQLAGIVGAALCGGGGETIYSSLLDRIPDELKGLVSGIATATLPPLDLDTWNGPGPKVVFDGGSNGSSWFQVYGFAVGTDTDSKSGKLVSSAKGVKVRKGAGSLEGSKTSHLAYFAQAEFFFDCSEDWASCDDTHNAMYAMRWRARLKQVTVPAVVERTFASMGKVIANAEGTLSWIRDRIPSATGDDPFSKLQEFVTNFLDSDLAQFLHISKDTVDSQVPDLGLIRVPDLSGFSGPTPIIH